jgi:uncharacterized secreted protein with C-terminal beta-propeller domain
MSKKIFKLSLIIVILAVFVSGCTLPWKKKAANNANTENSANTAAQDSSSNTKQLKKFGSYDELKNFLEENNTGNLGFSSGAANSATTSITIDGVPDQTANANEADIIKTDGTYTYALVRNELKIIKTDSASDIKVVSTITFKSRPQNIFINGTSLAVFGLDDQISTLEAYKSFRRQNPYTFFKVFDLSDPTNPALVRDLDFEGSYTDARLVGDYVYLFTDSSGNYIEGEPLVPRVIDGGTVLSSDCAASEKCFAPDVFYFDIPYDSYKFSNITAINIKDNAEAISGQSYLMNYGQNLYVSQNNIYITYTDTVNEYDLEQAVKRELIFSKLSTDDQNKITTIEATADYVLSASEKKIKVSNIVDNYLSSLGTDEQATIQTSVDNGLKQKLTEKSADMEKTVIYKIAFNGQHLEYRGSGEVNGQVLNQSSMDENGDYFRIATTRSAIWSRLSDTPSESYSSIFVLDNDLKVVGSLENLATNEKIYSAQFIGDRVYLITPKQNDPLYVVSLSDPTKPSVLGAVKVPDSLAHLHPADKNGNKLIGIGYDTEDDGAGNVKVKGLKIALFDFTDLTQPKELDSFVIGDAGSDSIALQDHEALLYSEEKNLLSLPASLKENDKLTFSGALVFNISNDKLVLKGKIDHSGGGASSIADYWNGYNYYDNTVKRSFYINDNLYTFSNKSLKINNLSDLSLIKSLTLTSGGDDYIITPTSAGIEIPAVSPSSTETASSTTGEAITPTATSSTATVATPNQTIGTSTETAASTTEATSGVASTSTSTNP